MNMPSQRQLLLLVVFLTPTHNSFAHSGGTDANGCHTQKSTGEYHCHTPKQPRLSINSNQGANEAIPQSQPSNVIRPIQGLPQGKTLPALQVAQNPEVKQLRDEIHEHETNATLWKALLTAGLAYVWLKKPKQ